MDSDEDDEQIKNDQYRPFNHEVIDGEDNPRPMVERFNSYFQENYYACPVFLPGTLEEALNNAFQTRSMQDRRPLLIYLHSDGAFFTRIFCAKIFTEERLIEYLMDKYFVWPWDVAAEDDRARFAEMWNNTFPDSDFVDLRVDECPMLIGVMQHSRREKRGFSPFDYETRVLLRHDPRQMTEQGLTLKQVLGTLRAFSEEWYRNEELLSFDFGESSRLCSDVWREISRYLTLHEAINAFTISILPLLSEVKTKVHLADPSYQFLQIIPQHLDQNRISSVRLPGTLLESRYDFPALHAFDQLVCLALLNPQRLEALPYILRRLPTVHAVSLWYDDEFQFQFLRDQFPLHFVDVTRLQVRCAGAIGDQCIPEENLYRYLRNTTIESFIFDSGHYQLRSNRYCSLNSQACFLRSVSELIGSLVNVRRVRFITDRYQIPIFLQIDQWRQIISRCTQLDRIIIQLLGDGDFRRQAENIEQDLRQLRPGLIFRIKSSR